MQKRYNNVLHQLVRHIWMVRGMFESADFIIKTRVRMDARGGQIAHSSTLNRDSGARDTAVACHPW